MKWRVAITGMNARADNPGPGLAVARCLQLADPGLSLLGLGYDVLDPGLYHPLCQAGYLLPYPAAGPEALLQRLLEIHSQQPLDAIVPCLDAELPNFIAIEPQLRSRGISTYLPSLSQLQARNKDRLGQLCQQLGLLTPETRSLSDPAFFRRCRQEGWSYPLVVKGPFYDAVVAHSPEQAEQAFQRLLSQWGYPVLVQKYYEGQEINLTGLGQNGELVGTVMMRKRGLTDKGKAWAGVSVVDEQLERLGAKLVKGLAWRGPLEVEVLRSAEGLLYLIEINPRFPAWIYLSQAVGRNLPLALLQLLQDPQAQLTFPPLRPGVMFLRYAEEVVVELKSFESLMMRGALS